MLKWLLGVLIAIDQLGNAITGGNPDNTISSRVGYFSNIAETKLKKFWKGVEKVINFTFKPIHGNDHCIMSYRSELHHTYEESSYFAIFVLSIIVIVACIPLSILIRIMSFIFPKIKK